MDIIKIGLLLVCGSVLVACNKSSPKAANNGSAMDRGLTSYRLVSADVDIENMLTPHEQKIYYIYSSNGEISSAQVRQNGQLVTTYEYTNVDAASWSIKLISAATGAEVFAIDRQYFDVQFIWNTAPDWSNSGSTGEPIWFGVNPPDSSQSSQPDAMTPVAPINVTRIERTFNAAGFVTRSLGYTLNEKGEPFLFSDSVLEYANNAELKSVTITGSNSFDPNYPSRRQYSYQYDVQENRISMSILSSPEGKTYTAQYEKAACGPMLTERSKTMLPSPTPYCIWR
ncbi:MAG TPA: hypothetical protein PK129_00150 [Cellvibrionaceae bacterium]|nr:hypothetical protein [Cellvibrionaceae bacterium]